MKARFEGELNLTLRDEPINGKWFKTLNSFKYISETEAIYRIPEGINTDFASIPRAFRFIIPRVGRHSKSAVFHDWLCEFKIVSRKKADKLFLESMKTYRAKKWYMRTVHWAKRRTMYFGVRAYSIVTFKK